MAVLLSLEPQVESLHSRWNGAQLTAAEFDALDVEADGYRYELINGVVIVSPAPGIGERDLNGELGYLLRNYQKTHPAGQHLTLTVSEQELKLTENRRRCDRAIWCGLPQLPDTTQDMPQIVVEFVSARTRDRQRDYVIKRAEYLQAGVLEYWIFDRFSRQLIVCRNEGDRVVREEEKYSTTLLPGFELACGELLKIADQWNKTK